MIDNIEKVLDRGEKLDLLVDKTELLQVGALFLCVIFFVIFMCWIELSGLVW